MKTHTAHARAAGPHHHDIPALKQRLRIPEVWRALGLTGQPAHVCRSPFRQDRSPSFSIYQDGRRWKDFATGEEGDVIDFIAAARQTGKGEALQHFLELAGVPCQPSRPLPPPARKSPPPQKAEPQKEQAQPDGVNVALQNGTEADRRLVAETRRISPEAVSLALALRTLTFAIVRGFRCWVLTDAQGRCAEARRLDGLPFPECGTLGRRKAHTLRGSRKSWPLGAAVLHRVPGFRTLLLVEGGPDYLAALHFATALERWDVLPVAMLGRGTGARIDPAALELMRGRRVRIYPHNDADGGGVKSARQWARQLHAAGCTVDIYEFNGLQRTDGTPVKDLNDCTSGLDAASAAELHHSLLPPPDLEVHPPY
ncbi:CHC2 zinc finger domain-containing protein [Prosthecobacter fluviatilis]|uniref:CHC2 zinc finger domain-containing protein n=1 Tax=Prosthecobacter fluviatilis TaxID=445931 RepID=A0ABW0KQ16_9BACT